MKKAQLGVKRKRGELGRRLDHHLLETERNAELAVDEPYAADFDDRHGALALLDLVERDRFFLGVSRKIPQGGITDSFLKKARALVKRRVLGYGGRTPWRNCPAGGIRLVCNPV